MEISGLNTGYDELNSHFSGWQRSDYNLVGYQDHGDALEFIVKTSSAITCDGGNVIVISPNRESDYGSEFSERIIVDHNNYTFFELRKVIRNLVRKDGASAIIVDDLISIDCSEFKIRNGKTKMEEMSHYMKCFAAELNMPIIALVPYKTINEIPRLRDINQYGDFKEYADVVIFLVNDNSVNLSPIVAKCRSGFISDVYGDQPDSSVPF